MRKNRLLSLVMTAMMTAAAALMLSSCSDNDSSADLALKYNVSGTWHAEFDADGTVGGSQMQYSRLITACKFNADGTGTWYKLMLTNDSGDPIAIDGGAGHGDFTYSVSADGKITCKLNWNQAPAYYPKTLALTAADGSITGTEGTVAYSMQRSPDAITSWIEDWDQQLNGGGNLKPTSFNANTDFTASTWRTEEWIYIYDGVGDHHPTKSGFTIVALPWNTEHNEGTLQTNLPDGFCNDITPENGWELALNLCGSSTGSVKNNNFFALYNKYLGILRFFYFMPAEFSSGNDHLWQVSMGDNLAQHSLYGYGVPSDFTFTNKALIGQTGADTYMEYVTPWVDYKSSDGLIVPNAGWWAFDVDLSIYRPNANHDTKSSIKLQMRSWDAHSISLYSTLTAGIEGTIKADLKLDQVAKKKSSSNSTKGVLMGLQATAQAGSALANFYTGNWANGLTSVGQMLGTGASLAGLGDGGGSTSYTGSLDGTISLGMNGNMNTDGVISGSKATTGVPSPTISLNDFDLKNSHMGQGVWNLKTAPKVYRMDYVSFQGWRNNDINNYYLSRPCFFDPSSIEVELNPDVFPESQIEWMEVDAICGASADKQCKPSNGVWNLTGNAALRDAYGVGTPGLEGYWPGYVGTPKLVENRNTCLWDFLYNMNDKHGMDALYTVLYNWPLKIQGRGKNGFAIEPQAAGWHMDGSGMLYVPYPFLEVNVKVKVKMRGMENPIVLSRNYLPEIVDYGDGSDFESSRSLYDYNYNQRKMYGHTDLYDYQMKRIDDIIKLYRTPKVGDLYYSDGTYSKKLEPGKTPIGVVAYVTDPSKHAEGEIFETGHGGGHGLVLCLKNAANHVKWSTEKVTKFSGQWVTDLAGLKRLNNVSGYSYTATMAANADRYPAAAAAKNYKGLPAPAGTTGWFLPSAQQWVKMMEGLGGLDESKIEWRNTFGHWYGVIDKWENALKKAGSGKYDSMNDADYTFWSSTECSAEEALMLDIWVTQSPRGFLFIPDTKGTAYINTYVRPILAF